MARENIDIGIQGNDGTGDSIRESFRKVNENFKQLFAVFGQGDRIAFTDLDDAPSSYDADTVIVANSDGTALLAKKLVAGTGIEIDNADETEVRIINTGGSVSADPTPELGGHLDGTGAFAIVRVVNPDDTVAGNISLDRSIPITADDMVMSRGYADQRYLQSSGGPGIGSQIRVRDEPVSTSEYTKSIVNWVGGYAVVTNHGFNTGSNGVKFVYYSTGTPASELVNGQTVYLRYVDANRLGVYATREDAINDDNRLPVNISPEIIARGTETFVDFYYDNELPGNWVSNEALPRKSVVRRQGDVMEGALILHDHPGTLAGAGAPNGQDDLQAATKFYVDNSSYTSDSNLFVSTTGDDLQTTTPPGKEGRAFSYAYATVGAACAKAEEIINAALTEPGPYRQALTYSNVTNLAYLNSIGGGPTGTARTLYVYTAGIGVDQSRLISNRDLREGSIIKGLSSGATAKVITYDGFGLGPSSTDDVYQIELLHYDSDITNFKTDFKFAAAKVLSNKDFIAAEVVAYIQAKYPTLQFDAVKCNRDARLIVDALAKDLKFGGNNETIRAGRSYYNGVVSVLPSGQVAQTVDGVDYLRQLAQAVIANVDIPVSTTSVDFGTRSTTPQVIDSSTEGEEGSSLIIGRLINAIEGIIQDGPKNKNQVIEFIPGENLEFGQPVPETQITIRVESGIYYEQLPIRVPTNVSIKGDEFRRSIIRPAPGQSQSPWAGIYFYRDDEFDGLTRTYTSGALTCTTKEVTTVSSLGDGTTATVNFAVQASIPFPSGSRIFLTGASIDAFNGHHVVITGTTSSITFASTALGNISSSGKIKGTIVNISSGSLTELETEMYLTVTGGAGIFEPNTQVTRIIDSSNFEINLAPKTQLTGSTVRGLNGSGLAPTGRNFGYHYLVDPTGENGIFDPAVSKTGGHSSAASILTTNRTNIRNQVISYIDTTFPNLVYDDAVCSRDVGLIVDAVVYDITNGGVSRSLAAGHAYRRNASARIAITTQLTETLAGITQINTLAQTLLAAESTAAKNMVADLIAGIKNIIIGTNNPAKANKDMDVFLLNDGTILRNITCQGHGGFMCVLDPEGQIQTKSPYFQTDTCLSGSVNKKSFRGGMFIDGFSGNLPATVNARTNSTTLTLGGLTVRAPGIPTSFVIQGERYQINAVSNYDRVAGTCTVILDASTPFPVNNPSTSAPWAYPYSIIIGTPGNKSMLANDFTQVNDLGYGVVATNNGLSELVSVFTYYNWTSYYSNNGAQIRSLNGSSCNGVYGLRSAGRDPNEVPDPVSLADNTLQSAKIVKRSNFVSRNLAGETSVYIDYYNYIPYNVSEIEIDHTPTRQSAAENSVELPNNITLVAAGNNYAVGNILTVNGGTVVTGQQATQFIVTSISGGGPTGPISGYELINPGKYSVPPTGGTPGSPITNGVVNTTVSSGIGAGATFNMNYRGPVVLYEISNLELTTMTGQGVNSSGIIVPKTVLKLNLNTQGRADAGTSLVSDLIDGQDIIIRSLQNVRFDGIETVQPTRPSTALEFTASYENSVYRTLAYNLSFPTGGALPANQAILQFDTSLNYLIIITNPGKLADTDYVAGAPKTMGSKAGDTRIAIQTISSATTISKINAAQFVTIINGRAHKVKNYTPPNTGLGQSAYIEIEDLAYGQGSNYPVTTPGLEPLDHSSSTLSALPTTEQRTLRAGLQAGENAEITVNISTCRATGHDFLDVGSGGFNSTNYPSNIYGSPVTAPVQDNEVIEETQGRVFYVSTDQDGIFRVGKFFEVDQGTGTIKFSASISLSQLDGIGFKRGTVVKEFSTDDKFPGEKDDAVPVEIAIQGYIDRRLGYRRDGTAVDLTERLPSGGGYLPSSLPSGTVTLEANLQMGSSIQKKIIGLALPTDPNDAATKGYVDTQIALTDSLVELKEVNIMTPSDGHLAFFTQTGQMMNAVVTGDVSLTLTSANIATLVGGITTPPTIDAGIIGTTQSSVSNGIVVNEDISGWPAAGHLRIGNEIFKYNSKTDATKTFDNITRAKFETVGAIHAAGADVICLDDSELELQLVAGTVVNADISNSAAIDQSKLSMSLAGATSSAPAGSAAVIQAANGLSSFDSANFDVTNGWVAIKAGGVALGEIQNIADGRILGNLSGSPAAPQEITTGTIVVNGIDTTFTNNMSSVGADVLVKQYNRLKPTATFVSITGDVNIAQWGGGSGTIPNVPVTKLTGSGNGLIVNVGFGAGAYNGVTVIHGGTGYADGDQLFIDGKLLGGISGAPGIGNDLTFTVESGVNNIDGTVYYGLSRVSQTAMPNAIVKTDSTGNLGNTVNRFNNIFASNFTGGTFTGSFLGTSGATINKFDSDSTFASSDDTTVPTKKAVKDWIDGRITTDNTFPVGDAAKLPTQGAVKDYVAGVITGGGTVANIQSFSISAGITAAGSDQATATILDRTINVITTAGTGEGVKLPTASAGNILIIRNQTANDSLLVYPASGAKIGLGSPNDPITLPSNASLLFFATSGTEWHLLNAAFA